MAVALAGAAPVEPPVDPVQVPAPVTASAICPLPDPVPAPAAPPVDPAPGKTQVALPQSPAPEVRPAPAADNEPAIVVTADLAGRKADPLSAVNAQSFAVVSKVDDILVSPLAKTYKHVLPEPARDGLHNALSNLTEPVVFVNDLLQLRPGRAFKTLLRFTINSTLGLGGLFDFAKKKPFNIRHHNNGFADTLGYYGVKPGPFLYLPLIGPTTVRDVFGRVVDLSMLPAAVGAPFNNPQFTLPQSAVKSLDDRLTFDARQRYFREETPDPYASERSYYLMIRANEIAGLHGDHPELSEQFGSPPPNAPPNPPPCPTAAAQKP